jgi:hypothetical protein
MSGENWESLITEKGFMRVPRALRLKRAELGITNNEYTILLDYVDYYSFSGTMNPYRHLTEVSGMSERGIKKVLASLEQKGLLKRKLSRHGNGRTNGVVFSIDPLVRKLRSIMKKSSPTVGEEMDTHVYEESFTPNTREEFNKREDDKNTSVKNTDVRARARDDVRLTEEITDESGAVETDYGFIRGTGGPHQEAPRNDRRAACECDAATEGGKASQIHLARAGDGPHGLVSGEGSERLEYEREAPPHPDYFGSSIDEPELSTFSASAVRAANSSLARNCFPRWGEGTENTGLPPNRCPGQARSRKTLPRNDGKRGGYTSSRWYNEVWRGLYEEAAGQPALTGMREYRAAETYFARLRELNPEMEPGEVYELAGECAAFMIASQLEGGVFGWMHKPPDICLLASQAQSVEWHLRKMRRGTLLSGSSGEVDISPPSYPFSEMSQPNGVLINSPASSEEATDSSLARNRPIKGEGIDDSGEGEEGSYSGTGSVPYHPSTGAGRADTASPAGSGGRGTKKSYTCADSALRERLREGRHANEQIERVYGELRGIERAASAGSFENECGRGSGRTLRQSGSSTLRLRSGRASLRTGKLPASSRLRRASRANGRAPGA